jgi:uncharacterized membrane protein YphA (DoxX/SURF4 family)
MEKLISPARLLFAIAIAALGAENLICAHVSQAAFAKNPPVVPVLPFVPALPFLAYLFGVLLLLCGLSIAANIRPRTAAILLGSFFLLCVVILFVPKVIVSPLDLNVRTCFFEELAIGASALILAGRLQTQREGRIPTRSPALSSLIAAAPYLFAISSVVFGITHFLILRFIASLVPAWIPGALFWACLTGAAFIAAGISIATGVMARWGAFFLGIMFLLWFLVLHAPRVLIHPHRPDEWSSAFIALAMCGGSWIVASRSPQN